MPAVYPGSVRTFTTKVNNVDIIDASHPNVIQEEVVALQTVLGVNPQISSGGAGVFASVPTTFASVSARMDNIERGLISDVHTQYVRNSGGSLVNAATAATIGLAIQGASGQTANLQEWRNSAGTVVAAIAPDGSIVQSNLSTELDNLFIVSWVFG